MSWPIYALISALFAALTAILAKLGVEGVPSTLATAIRTVVILLFAWSIVFAKGEQQSLGALSKRTLIFLVLSGITTGLSWLAYFRALQLGPASRVAPIDKASLALTVLLGVLILKEPLTWKLGVGVALIIAGTLLTTLK